MKYTVIILNCLIFLYYTCIAKKRFHPLMFFSGLWLSLSLLSSLELYGLYSVSYQMWSYVLFGEIAFIIPFIFSNIRLNRVQMSNKDVELPIVSTKINSYILDFAIAFVVILSLIEMYGAIRQYLSGMNMAQVRAAYFGYGTNASNTKITTIIHTYISEPLRVALRPIIIVDYFVYSHSKIRFGIEMFIIGAGVIISGGRFELAYFLIQFLTVLFLFYGKKEEYIRKRVTKRKKVGKAIIIGSGIILIIYLIGQTRGSTDFIRTIYLSLAEPLINCDCRINMLQNSNVRFFYGLVSLRGILNPIFFTLKQLGLLSYPQLYLLAGDYMNTQNYIQVGEKIRTNAYVTPLYDLYLDGGIFGIIIGMFILGIITLIVYNAFGKHYYNNNTDARSIVLYLIIINSIIQMLHTLAWVDTSYTIAIVFVYLLTRRFRYKDINEKVYVKKNN